MSSADGDTATTKDDKASEENAKQTESKQVKDVVELPSSEPFTPREAAVVTRARSTNLIVLGGPQSSGKTTLIASIYERLHLGPFAGRMASWCSTLMGFERICHLGREESGLTKPDTLHTSLQVGKQIYHLRMYSPERRSHQDVLLTDLSGEVFEGIRGFDEECTHLQFLRRADHFSLLLDGERVSSLSTRHQTFDEGATILRVLIERGLLSQQTHVQVVFSKWDLIDRADTSEGVKEYLQHAEESLTERFARSFATLSFYRTVARDPDGAYMMATGVESLLSTWCDHRRLWREDSPMRIHDWTGFREVDRFLVAQRTGY